MVSGKARSQQIKDKRVVRKKKEAKAKVQALPKDVCVNASLLAPYNSYGVPQFVLRGYYVDIPFVCKDCAKSEIWTAQQQKWWYETAKGSVESTAIRCRACRRKERQRKREARIKSRHFKAGDDK